MTECDNLTQIVLTILTSIITGGFVLVFVEIGNRSNRENDHYAIYMNPFIHKLSAYCRFISWCDGHICYPNSPNEKENEFQKLIKKIRLLGSRLILSGGDFPIDYFDLKQLNQIALDINNIWYWLDKMKPCRLTWRDFSDGENYLANELSEINPTYLSQPYNLNLISRLSGDFYVYTFKPIEYDMFIHKAYLKLYRRQTVFVSITVSIVLVVLSLMLFIKLPVLLLQLSTIIVVIMLLTALLMLGVDIKKQIRLHNKLSLIFNVKRHIKKLYVKVRNWNVCRHIMK